MSTAVTDPVRTDLSPVARPRKSGKLRLHHPLTPYALCAPYPLLLLTFVVGPMIFGVWISLHDWDLMLPNKPFIGLQNYKDIFDPTSVIALPFWHGMRATGIFIVASVPFLVLVPLGVATLLNRRFRGRTFFRAMIFAPFVHRLRRWMRPRTDRTGSPPHRPGRSRC